jgi:aerobic-type carbon monoxide dehydrogenase small subunit (CoxS/CutS family)
VLQLRVNGADHHVAARPSDILLDVLREALHLTGTKRGCDLGTCGCCAVHIDGETRLACLTLAAEAEGCEVRTIEDIADGPRLHPLQAALAELGGSQCGFCTPGFIMTGVAWLDENPDPSREEIREAIGGNMCRCTGYMKIVDAFEQAAAVLRGEQEPLPDPDDVQPGPGPHELLP